jgi:hypothetical protein
MQQQIRQRVMYEDGSLLGRPASAQGRFTSPANRAAAAPPGFDTLESNHAPAAEDLDPAMAQALATLSASGNLTPQQIQQLQMQLRQTASPADKNAKMAQTIQKPSTPQPRGTAGNSPTRSKEKRDPSPTMNGEGSSPVRSALLEEFRTNKTKKYELSV